MDIDECLEISELHDTKYFAIYRTVALALKCVYNSIMQQHEFALYYARQCSDSLANFNVVELSTPFVGFALLRVVDVYFLNQQMDEFYSLIRIIRSVGNTWPALIPLCQKAMNGKDCDGEEIPLVFRKLEEMELYSEFEPDGADVQTSDEEYSSDF